MRVILQVLTGPSQGRQIPLQSGEVARFGRSDVADVCFPEDLQMSEVHFELECQTDRCLVRDIGSNSGTLLNEQPVSEAAFGNGDVILAGQTRLVTSVEGLPGGDSNAEEEAVEEEPEPKLSASELCSLVELEEESLQLFRPTHSPDEYIRVLAEQKQYSDAMQLLARYLPKRDAVFWAHECVDKIYARELTADERSALEASMAWLLEPTDEHRRAAMAIAEAADLGTPASWVALSVFWSGGSIAPLGLPEAPPEPHLCGQGVAGCLLMTAAEGDFSEGEQRNDGIMKMGLQLLSGAIKTPPVKGDD